MGSKELVLNFVRQKLTEFGAQALIVPTADAHQSEYVSEHDKVRQFVSGFAGSAGTAIVTTTALSTHSQLFTDGRYHEQASKELDPSLWNLQKSGLPSVLSPENWLVQQYSTASIPSSVVAYDPLQLSAAQYQTFEGVLSAAGILLHPTPSNFVSDAWDALEPATREPVSTNQVVPQPEEYAGPHSAADKVASLRTIMEKNNVYALVVCALDEIAWLFNLRGSDIAFNPVFMSYALITMNDTTLFVNDSCDNSRLSDARASLTAAFSAPNAGSLTIAPYEAMKKEVGVLTSYALTRMRDGKSHLIWADPNKTNMMVMNVISAMAQQTGVDVSQLVHKAPSPVAAKKAVKNSAELLGMEQSHIRDGLALSSFLARFEQEFSKLPSRNASEQEKNASPWNEHTIAEWLESVRKVQPLFKGLSFDSISSIGGNGAVIHYKPPTVGSSPLTTGKVYLLDSGAQFQDGTTDVTRTFFLAKPKPENGEIVEDDSEKDQETDYHPSKEQKTAFTLVLQGHIALAQAIFPHGTVGPTLDILARQFLWKRGLDYAHGTGHGVGSFLNVHEGPIGISPVGRGGLPLATPLLPGMILSNEPGYYKTGEYGIRIENLVEVVQSPINNFYGFKNLTTVPIDRQMIDCSILSPSEIEWVNTYHSECATNLLALLEKQSQDASIFSNEKDVSVTRDWIVRNTAPLM